MIGSRWRGQPRKFGGTVGLLSAPVEIATINDDTTNGSSVAISGSESAVNSFGENTPPTHPPIHLVHDSTTTLAPYLIGRQVKPHIPKVLSTTNATFFSAQILAIASKSGIEYDGFDVVSQ